ncbi:MAG: oxidoreductase, partial [Phototrophicales bacterium]
AEYSEVHLARPDKMAGYIELAYARVRWFLSVDANDLPEAVRASGGYAFRSLTIDGQEVEFSEGFGDLHTRVYEQVLAGSGFGIETARPSLELVYQIRHADTALSPKVLHPILSNP